MALGTLRPPARWPHDTASKTPNMTKEETMRSATILIHLGLATGLGLSIGLLSLLQAV